MHTNVSICEATLRRLNNIKIYTAGIGYVEGNYLEVSQVTYYGGLDINSAES